MMIFDALSEIRAAVCDGQPETRLLILRELSNLGLRPLAKTETLYWRVRAARQLLDAGITTAEASRAISERYGVSMRSAWRAVRAARQDKCEP